MKRCAWLLLGELVSAEPVSDLGLWGGAAVSIYLLGRLIDQISRLDLRINTLLPSGAEILWVSLSAISWIVLQVNGV
jgi:hypothetical protein